MLKKSLPFLFAFLLISCGGINNHHVELKLIKDSSYPRWLSGTINADQTSGITFINEIENGDKYFLLADDTGSILHLKISNDTVFTLNPVIFSENFKAFIDSFPKPDFEEIVYDKTRKEVYLSIEGDGRNPAKYAGIYKLYFSNDDVLSDTLAGIEKVNITPHNLFDKYIADNIGYEGLAIDDNYFYIGLEGFTRSGIFADSTILFIADRNSGRIIKQINTKSLGIHTICGLYSDENNSVYGIDRNNRTFFHLLFDESLNLKDTANVKIETNIPNYKTFDYVASLESVTMDSQKNIYLADDPWRTFFIPSNEILNQLDSSTVKRFRNFVPVIYKYLLSK